MVVSLSVLVMLRKDAGNEGEEDQENLGIQMNGQEVGVFRAVRDV